MNPLKGIYRNLLLAFNNIPRPVDRGMYAVNRGDFAGEFFVFIKMDNNYNYEFLSLPKMLPRTVPVNSFQNGVKHKIISFIEKLPKQVFSVCIAQYFKCKKQPLITGAKP